MKSRATIVVGALASLALVACQAPPAEDAADQNPAATSQPEAPPDLSTADGKIADAMRAAPLAIAADATIMDWPAAEGAEMTTLREGTNGWTCLPTGPSAAARGAREPMCADEVMMQWLTAFMSGTEPTITGVGLSYMLAGDGGASNVDPFATGPTADNDWVVSGPHIMMVVPDTASLEALGTEHQSGQPYVMWKGTPWAHIMMPVSD